MIKHKIEPSKAIEIANDLEEQIRKSGVQTMPIQVIWKTQEWLEPTWPLGNGKIPARKTAKNKGLLDRKGKRLVREDNGVWNADGVFVPEWRPLTSLMWDVWTMEEAPQ